MTRSTSGARASASPLPNALGMPNSAATARARSMLPLAIAVTATAKPHHAPVPARRPLPPRPFLPRAAAAGPAGRRRFESDGGLAREGNEGVYAAPLLGRAAAGRARHREREGEESRQSQRE